MIIDVQDLYGNRFENVNVICLMDPPIPDGLSYYIDNGEAIITDYYGNAEELIIPSYIEGYPVTTISGYAFEDTFCLYRIVLPETLNYIGAGAFFDCQDTVEIDIPESVEFIGAEAFAYCHSLQNVHIPDGITSIKDNTFAYCYSLKTLTIPTSITHIYMDAFFSDMGYINSTTVYYEGSPEMWEMVNISSGNSLFYNSNTEMVFLRDAYATLSARGDIDGDGTVNGKDSNYMAGILSGNITAKTKNATYPNADIDGDGAVTGKDAFILKNIIAGNIVP